MSVDQVQELALKMVSFKEEVSKLNDLKGTVSEVKDFEFAEANEDTITEQNCLKDIHGFSFFTLGPVYVGAQVPFSFLEQYTAEADQDTQFLLAELPCKFANGLEVYEESVQVGDWGDKIHGVQSDKLENVTDFMTSQVLGRTSEGKVYGIEYKDMILVDPVLKHRGKLKADSHIKVRVFYPFSKRGAVEANVDLRSDTLIFKIVPPSQDQINYLNAVISTQAKGAQCH